MREIAVKLINRLNSTSAVLTSTELSHSLGISKRTVKNIVAEINQEIAGLIESSTKGYTLNEAKMNQPENNSWISGIPQTPSERMYFILKKLLLESYPADELLDIFDLSDELMVSEATIQKDLLKVRRYLKNYDIAVNSSLGKIRMEGQESDKRRVLNTLYYQEIEKGEVSINSIKALFPSYDIERISEIILDATRKRHYFINHFSLLNVVMYVIISIDRIKEDFFYEDVELAKLKQHKKFDENERKMIYTISSNLGELYQFKYSPLELEELGTILIGNILISDFRNLEQKKLLHLVGPDTLTLVDEMIKDVKDYYGFIEVNQDFLTRFSLHINNLLTRLKVNYNNKNPLADRIKYAYPLLFDSAVRMSNTIYKQTGYQISDDEIALMVLHLGTLFEEVEKEKDNLNAALIIPDYHDVFTRLVDKIEKKFPSLVLKKMAPEDSELYTDEYFEQLDMVITTVPIDIAGINPVYVTPLLTKNDVLNLEETIKTIRSNKQKIYLKGVLSEITSPVFFQKNESIREQKALIQTLCQRFEQKGLVPAEFVTDVLNREQLSSTAFGMIAIPHALTMDASETMLSISIYDKPIFWGENEVQIVFLFAINKNKKKPFNAIFDHLIVDLSDKNDLRYLTNSDSYEEFLDNLLKIV